MPSDPSPEILSRLQSILVEKPLLMAQLGEYPPLDITLTTLVEVLDTLKEPGVSESTIRAFFARPTSEWGGEVFRSQSANVDPTTSAHKADSADLLKLFLDMTGLKVSTICDEMYLLS